MDTTQFNYKAFKEARKRKGLKLQEVADHIGVTFGQVGHYESGRSFPPFDKLVKLCELLELDLNDVKAEAA